MNEFNIGRKDILQPKAIDGVRVATTYLHDAIVPSRISETTNLLRSFRDQIGVAEFVHILHLGSPSGVAFSIQLDGAGTVSAVFQTISTDLLHSLFHFA